MPSGDLVGVVFFFMSFAFGIVWRVTKHQQEMAKIKQSQPQESSGEIERLKQELANLRETTTRYDMSVEHSLTEIKHRMDHLEAQRNQASRSTINYDQPEQQKLTHRIGD